MADRRPVHLRADGFGYVRRRHDGYLVCSFSRGWLRLSLSAHLFVRVRLLPVCGLYIGLWAELDCGNARL